MIMNETTTNRRSDRASRLEYDNLFFCFAIIFPSVVSLFTQTIRLFISTRSLDTLLMYGLMLIVIIKILPQIRYLITLKEVILIFGFAIAFLLSAINPIFDSQLTRQVLGEILTSGVLVYFGAKLVHDSPVLHKYLRISSIILLLRVLANTYVFNTSALLTVGYSQADGYYLLTGMAFLITPLITEHRIFDIVVAAITLVVTLLTGARGPFMFSALLLVIGLFLSSTNEKKKKGIYVVAVVVIILIYRYMQQILIFISTFVGGSSSLRTINRLLNNELFQDSKRLTQYNIAWDYIKEHLLWGCGVVNDRTIIYRTMPSGSFNGVIGSYPHNLFLELGMQFGFVVGAILSIVVLVIIIKAYRRSFSLREKLLIIALIMTGLVPLMVSGSYLSHTMFFALLGYCNRGSNTFDIEEPVGSINCN